MALAAALLPSPGVAPAALTATRGGLSADRADEILADFATRLSWLRRQQVPGSASPFLTSAADAESGAIVALERFRCLYAPAGAGLLAVVVAHASEAPFAPQQVLVDVVEAVRALGDLERRFGEIYLAVSHVLTAGESGAAAAVAKPLERAAEWPSDPAEEDPNDARRVQAAKAAGDARWAMGVFLAEPAVREALAEARVSGSTGGGEGDDDLSFGSPPCVAPREDEFEVSDDEASSSDFSSEPSSSDFSSEPSVSVSVELEPSPEPEEPAVELSGEAGAPEGAPEGSPGGAPEEKQQEPSLLDLSFSAPAPAAAAAGTDLFAAFDAAPAPAPAGAGTDLFASFDAAPAPAPAPAAAAGGTDLFAAFSAAPAPAPAPASAPAGQNELFAAFEQPASPSPTPQPASPTPGARLLVSAVVTEELSVQYQQDQLAKCVVDGTLTLATVWERGQDGGVPPAFQVRLDGAPASDAGGGLVGADGRAEVPVGQPPAAALRYRLPPSVKPVPFRVQARHSRVEGGVQVAVRVQVNPAFKHPVAGLQLAVQLPPLPGAFQALQSQPAGAQWVDGQVLWKLARLPAQPTFTLTARVSSGGSAAAAAAAGPVVVRARFHCLERLLSSVEVRTASVDGLPMACKVVKRFKGSFSAV